MLKHPDLTRSRIESFLRELKKSLFQESLPLSASVKNVNPEGLRDYRDLHWDPVKLAAGEYQKVETGYAWGPVWTDRWFRLEGLIPNTWKGKMVAARLDLGSEAIVWEGDNPQQGIDHNHELFQLTESAKGGETIQLTVQATGMGDGISIHGRPGPPRPEPFEFKRADLVALDPERIGLYLDVKVALGVMKEQPGDSPRFGQLLRVLNDTVNAVDLADPQTFAPARKLLAEVYARPAGEFAHQLSAIGHAHIDSAWLWPLERTQFKCIHTFSTALRLMDQYPEYKFICSQPAQYAWVKQMAPKLYERIREKIKTGQWEVTGSMWVEADCNLSSGESLVRQLLYGKRFFLDEFGIETHDLWLPDVFGYSAALPQILKRAGVDVFMTQKISWNQVNKFPHHTFLWQGIDGTQIFTHFPPADTYNGSMDPSELAHNVRNFREHDRSNRSLYVFGFGDGGGGPTQEMLENARRVADVDGMPRVTLEKSSEFFRKAVDEARDLPVWVGELYLELHRGTYTTQAANKRDNRRAEQTLREAEFFSLINSQGLANYPGEELERAWKSTLLNQFHDIIPGSSIAEVYKDSAQDYSEILKLTESLIEKNLQALAGNVNTTGVKRPVLVASNLSHFSNEAVDVPLTAEEEPAAVLGPDGEVMPVQILQDEAGNRKALFVAKNVPLHGYAVWDLNATRYLADEAERVKVSANHLENDLIRVEFDQETGLITRIFDKVTEREVLHETIEVLPNGRRQVIPEKCANGLQLFEDKPLFWDAWDIDVFSLEKHTLLTELESMKVVENGPVRGAIQQVRRFGASTITQTIRLTAGSPRIDFVTEVDWQEDERLLKAAFPVSINSARATFEIQFGHVERPTHTNTSWDLARFEVCAQRWVDLSEGDYGVALLNDCKYGHDVQGDTLRLTLLRAPMAPDPHADRGLNQFTYSLLPHDGDLRDGEVVEHAAALNMPPRASAITGNQPGPLPLQRSFFEVDNAGIFIEAIKRSEQGDAVIVRLVEQHNTRGEVTLTTTLPVKRAWLSDLMENDVAEIPVESGTVLLPVQPFEVITVKLQIR